MSAVARKIGAEIEKVENERARANMAIRDWGISLENAITKDDEDMAVRMIEAYKRDLVAAEGLLPGLNLALAIANKEA